jgi:hypothetical protein
MILVLATKTPMENEMMKAFRLFKAWWIRFSTWLPEDQL